MCCAEHLWCLCHGWSPGQKGNSQPRADHAEERAWLLSVTVWGQGHLPATSCQFGKIIQLRQRKECQVEEVFSAPLSLLVCPLLWRKYGTELKENQRSCLQKLLQFVEFLINLFPLPFSKMKLSEVRTTLKSGPSMKFSIFCLKTEMYLFSKEESLEYFNTIIQTPMCFTKQTKQRGGPAKTLHNCPTLCYFTSYLPPSEYSTKNACMPWADCHVC